MSIHKCSSCNIQYKKKKTLALQKSMYIQNKKYVQKHRNGYAQRLMTVSCLLFQTSEMHLRIFSLHGFAQVCSVVCELVSVGSARHAAPRSRTRWLRCTAALCSTCSALGSSRPPASGAASAPAASSAASAPACRASWTTAPSSPPGWSYTESCRGKKTGMRWDKHVNTLVHFSY